MLLSYLSENDKKYKRRGIDFVTKQLLLLAGDDQETHIENFINEFYKYSFQ